MRGFGLISGLELDRAGAPIVDACMEKGFLINCAQEKILRFLPPLIIGKDDIDLLIETLNEILNQLT